MGEHWYPLSAMCRLRKAHASATRLQLFGFPFPPSGVRCQQSGGGCERHAAFDAGVVEAAAASERHLPCNSLPF
jgi:hypothetical protein